MCNAINNDCGHSHHSSCFCNEEQGSGYTYSDEYGGCDFCLGRFEEGTIVCAGPDNEMRECPDEKEEPEAHPES